MSDLFLSLLPIALLVLTMAAALFFLWLFWRYLADGNIRVLAAELVRAAAQKAENGSLEDNGAAKKAYAAQMLKAQFPKLTDAQIDMYIESAWFALKLFIQGAVAITTSEPQPLPASPPAAPQIDAPPKTRRKRPAKTTID